MRQPVALRTRVGDQGEDREEAQRERGVAGVGCLLADRHLVGGQQAGDERNDGRVPQDRAGAVVRFRQRLVDAQRRDSRWGLQVEHLVVGDLEGQVRRQ